MLLYAIIMPRETNKTTVHNININDNITFFSEDRTFLFSPHEYREHAKDSKNQHHNNN